MIEKTAGYFLTTLKEAGDLLSTHEFRTLTPDVTRFLLKQREKYLQDNNQDGMLNKCVPIEYKRSKYFIQYMSAGEEF